VPTYTLSATSDEDSELLLAQSSCDPGDVMTGGGFITSGILETSSGQFSGSPTGWRATADRRPDGPSSLKTQTICYDLPPLRAASAQVGP
jgi:hypothetical protein